MYSVGEIFTGEKKTDSESEKLDIAQGGIDDIPPLESLESIRRRCSKIN